MGNILVASGFRGFMGRYVLRHLVGAEMTGTKLSRIENSEEIMDDLQNFYRSRIEMRSMSAKKQRAQTYLRQYEQLGKSLDKASSPEKFDEYKDTLKKYDSLRISYKRGMKSIRLRHGIPKHLFDFLTESVFGHPMEKENKSVMDTQNMNCHQLAAAVMIQALRDYRDLVKLFGHNVAQQCEVYGWLTSESDEPFSSKWICEVLGADHEAFTKESNMDGDELLKKINFAMYSLGGINGGLRRNGRKGPGLHSGSRFGDWQSEIRAGAVGGIPKDEEGDLDAVGAGIGDLDTCGAGEGSVCRQGIPTTDQSPWDSSREGGNIEMAIACGRTEDRSLANTIS